MAAPDPASAFWGVRENGKVSGLHGDAHVSLTVHERLALLNADVARIAVDQTFFEGGSSTLLINREKECYGLVMTYSLD
jgi:hypothetical protein